MAEKVMGAVVRNAANINRAFVGNLAWTVSAAELRQYFSKFGNVVGGNIVMDKQTGLSRGIGFVSFSNEKGLQNALDQPKQMLAGREIVVRPAAARQDNRRPGPSAANKEAAKTQ